MLRLRFTSFCKSELEYRTPTLDGFSVRSTFGCCFAGVLTVRVEQIGRRRASAVLDRGLGHQVIAFLNDSTTNPNRPQRLILVLSAGQTSALSRRAPRNRQSPKAAPDGA